MKIIIKYILLLLLFFGSTQNWVKAENQHAVDSLKKILTQNLHDTTIAQVYYELAKQYWEAKPTPSQTLASQRIAHTYSTECFKYANKANYYTGMGNSCYLRGYIYCEQKKFKLAIDWLKLGLYFYLKTDINQDISKSYFMLGYCYLYINDYANALKYNNLCLELDIQTGDSNDVAGLLHNIGMIYDRAGDRKLAKENVLKALKINLRTQYKEWLVANYDALGNFSLAEGKFNEGLNYFTKGNQIYHSLNDKYGYGMNLIRIGNAYVLLKKYSMALDTLNKALGITKEIQDMNGVALTYNFLALTYTRMHRFREAKICLDSCYKLCLLLPPSDAIRNVYQRIYEFDSTSQNYAAAFHSYRKYIQQRDSIDSHENLRKASNEKLEFEFSLREEKAKSEQEAKDELNRITNNSLLVGLVLVMIIAFILFNRYRLKKRAHSLIEKEKERSENLLLNILPKEVAEELKENGESKAKQFHEVTVMFTDFKGFTQIAEQLSPSELVEEIHYCFKEFDRIISSHNIEKIKTIGDSYMCAGGLPIQNQNHAIDVVSAALEIQEFMKNHKQKQIAANKPVFDLRIGIHTGPVVAGIVGVKKFAYDIWGDTVNTASRLESSGEAGKVNISSSTYEKVKHIFSCTSRGFIDAKSKGKIEMYYVDGN